MTNRTLRNAGALLLWLTPLASLQAHDSRPLYVEIVQHSEQQFSLHWKVPDSVCAVSTPSSGHRPPSSWMADRCGVPLISTAMLPMFEP